jgi:hypothetical protein
MKRLASILRSTLLVAPAGAAFLAGELPTWAQQPQSPSPVAAVSSEVKRYPDGNRLHEEYATPNQPLAAPAATRAARSAVTGLAAAARIQATLPEGFTVLPGPTKQIGASVTGANAAPSAAPGVNPPAAPSDEKFITVHPLAYRGVPLAKGSDYMTMVGGDNRLLVTRRRGLPNAVDGTTSTVAPEAALAAARQVGGPALTAAGVQQTKPILEVWVDDQQSGHLTWTFTLSGGSPADPDSRTFWVAAIGEPRVLHWESEIYHTQHGSVTGNIFTTSSATGAPTGNRPFADLTVTRSTDSARVTTGADGRYGYVTGTGNAQITALLQGPFALIQNQAGPGLQVVQPGGTVNPIDLNFGASSETDMAQTTAFYWTNFAHELAQPVLGPTALANLPVRTSINATCNAFWNGSSLNFFHAGGGCPNTAYSDVILHEFGHGVDAANGGIIDGGYSEGFGDSVAVLGTRQPCVGRDFFGPGTCLRPATDVVFWPPPAGDEVHDIGRRYAGFVWELVQQLKQDNSDDEAFRLATRLVLGSAAGNPTNIPDAVRLSFVVDAPDGNPAHGSPHFRALAAAADSRHIPRPADPVAGGSATSASATFPWSSFKTVNTNSVILQVGIHLDRPAALHMIANSSAMSTAAIAFQTGFYNDPNPNVVWTSSYRNLALSANQWENFGSTAAINLPAGDHTIYWKIWVVGGKLTLSSGSLLVEGFEGVGSSFNVAGVDEPAQTVAPANAPLLPTIGTDAFGQTVTLAASP